MTSTRRRSPSLRVGWYRRRMAIQSDHQAKLSQPTTKSKLVIHSERKQIPKSQTNNRLHHEAITQSHLQPDSFRNVNVYQHQTVERMAYRCDEIKIEGSFGCVNPNENHTASSVSRMPTCRGDVQRSQILHL